MSSLKVSANSFTEKVTYTCEIYSSTNTNLLLGSAQITLTDLTDTLPIYLMLESNLSQNVQIKEGDLYTPKFSEKNKEIIVTPSLFVGRQEQEDYYDRIYYQVGESTADGKEKDYSQSSTSTTIWVDDEGQLHYNQDLTKSITIEAYVKEYPIPGREDQTVTVHANNPINIMFVESGGNEYSAIIKSSGNREHFEESKQADIILTAELRKGGVPVDSGVSYSWDIVTDKDTDGTGDDTSTLNGLNSTKTDFKGTGKTLTVSRSNVSGVETFICTMTLQDGSGLSFTATKTLRDFIDQYQSQIIADSSLILTPENKSVELTNQIWHLNELINETDSNRFAYEWYLLKKNGNQLQLKDQNGNNITTKTIEIEIGKNNIPSTDEVFSILGKAIIDGKTNTVGYVDIRYQPTPYSVEVTPKTLFVPATSNGGYNGTGSTIERTFTFRLVNEQKNPLTYVDTGSTAPSLKSPGSNDKTGLSVTQLVKNGVKYWSFDIKLTIDTSSNNNLWSSTEDFKIYEFNYQYLGQPFTEEVEIVKSYAGQNGQPGQNGAPGSSGYTIDLSNEFHAFAGGEMRADPNQDTSTIISAFLANEPKKISKIWIGDQ